MRFALPSIPCVILFSAAAFGQPSTSLPSMNYWDLVTELIHNQRLRSNLDASPQQIAELTALRGDSELSQIVELKARVITRQAMIDREPHSSAEIRQRVLLELEPVVKTRLLRILENEQLDALRRFAMREKYGDGYSAFMSREVRQHCGFKDAELLETVRKEKAAADKLTSDAAMASAQRFVDTLPIAARLKFAYYAGPDKFPRVRMTNELLDELTNAKLPFPGNYGLIDALAVFPPIQAVVGVTASQIEAMKRLKENLEKELGDLTPPAPPGKMEKYNQSYHALHAKYKELSEEVLDDSQVLIVNRLHAFGEYQTDPTAAFNRPEFIAYLDLSPDELQTAMAIAHEERVKLQHQYRSFRKSCFTAISKEINPLARDRLFDLFKGVFD